MNLKELFEWQQTTGHPYRCKLMYNAIGIFAKIRLQSSCNYPHWSTAKPGDVIFRDVAAMVKLDGDDRILIDETDAPETYYGVNLDAYI